MYVMSMHDEFYTLEDVAKLLKIKQRTVRMMIKNKVLMACNIGSQSRARWRIYQSHIDSFITEKYEAQENNSHVLNKSRKSIEDIPSENFEEIKKLIRKESKINHKGCWVWLLRKSLGYGAMRVIIENKKHWFPTHRVSCWIWKKESVDNKLVLHKCHNRSCCNPSHLYIGTDKDNAIDRKENNEGINHLESYCERHNRS